MKYPYTQGWPTNPFKQLTPAEMQKLLKKMQEQRRNEMEDALW